MTAVFVDIVQSTELMMRLGAERMKRELDATFASLRDIIAANGGTVEHYAGDSVFALFGAPSAHADDAVRALRAAEACVRWASQADRMPVRVGVETGEALVDLAAVEGERERMAVGPCVTTAARLQQLAQPSEALVGPTCRDAAGDGVELEALGERDLKGIGALGVWRLARVVPSPHAIETPFVGRDSELEVLTLAARRARGGRSVLALVSGPPGQGKTRVVRQLTRHLGDDVRVIEAVCRPGGENGARTPLWQIVATDVPEPTLERIAARCHQLLSAGSPDLRVVAALAYSAGIAVSGELRELPLEERTDEITNAWRRYLGALAREKPLVLWIEDLHWAELDLVKLVDRLTAAGDAPLLVVATARPEFAESAGLRPSGDRFFIELEALGRDEAIALAGTAGSADERTVSRAEGNPLFIIELARQRADGAIPLSLHGAIGARIDDLVTGERELLQTAAIVGEAFSARDVAVLMDRSAPEVAVVLGRLVDRAYLRPAANGYRFHHALVRDVAYGRLPAAERNRLHARYARECVSAEDVETLARHWWEALRPPDAEWVWEGHAELLAMRRAAFDACLAAGNRSAARLAREAAIEAYERAVRLSDATGQVAAVERAFGDLYAAELDGDAAWPHYQRALDAYRAMGDPPSDFLADLAFLVTMRRGAFHPEMAIERIRPHVDEAERVARAAGDRLSLLRVLAGRIGRLEDEAPIAEAVRIAGDLAGERGAFEALEALAFALTGRVQIDLVRPLIECADALVAMGTATPDSYFMTRVDFYVTAGDVKSARLYAQRYLADTASRGPHLRTHALGIGALVAFVTGDWSGLDDLGDEARTLVLRNPPNTVCIGGAAPALMWSSCGKALRGSRDEAEELLRRAAKIHTADTGLVLVLAHAMVGHRGDVLRLAADETNRFLVLRGAALVVAGRYDLAATVLDRFDSLDFGARGVRDMPAIAEALREEIAAASGGPQPRHGALQELGLGGWSEIVSHRCV